MPRITVRLDLGSPILYPRRGSVLVFDRILAGAQAHMKHGSDSYNRNPSVIGWEDEVTLPLERDPSTGVWAVSQARFPHGAFIGKTIVVKKAREEQLPWRNNVSKEEKAANIVAFSQAEAGSSRFRQWLIHLRTIEAPCVEFDADVPDDKVNDFLALLDMIERNGIGADRHRGWGVVVGHDGTGLRTSEPNAAWRNGVPSRPIPVRLLDRAKVEEWLDAGLVSVVSHTTSLPAWLTPEEPCVLPPRTEWYPSLWKASDEEVTTK